MVGLRVHGVGPDNIGAEFLEVGDVSLTVIRVRQGINVVVIRMLLPCDGIGRIVLCSRLD